MQIVAISKPALTAHDLFKLAAAQYARAGQEDSAIAQMTRGLVALSEQVARIENAVDTARIP